MSNWRGLRSSARGLGMGERQSLTERKQFFLHLTAESGTSDCDTYPCNPLLILCPVVSEGYRASNKEDNYNPLNTVHVDHHYVGEPEGGV